MNIGFEEKQMHSIVVGSFQGLDSFFSQALRKNPNSLLKDLISSNKY